MPTRASEYHGMRDAKSREGRAKAPSGLGNPILSWISMGAPGIRRFFDLAIDSKLHGCSLVKIKIGDIVCDRKVHAWAIVVQQKTGRPVQFELMDDARISFIRWLELRGGSLEDYAFPSRALGAFATRCKKDRP